MAYLQIVPDKTIKGKRVFGLVAVWAHPLQAHHPSLGKAAFKLRLLISTGKDWAYAFAQLNEGVLHMPLSSEGHISVMVDGVPSMGPCGCLSQLEVHKFFQCGDQVVCPKGLNGELEPTQFTFPEPTLGKPCHETLLLWVDLSSMKPSNEAPIASIPLMSSLPPSSMPTTMKYPCEAATSMTAEIQGTSVTSCAQHFSPSPGHTTPRRSPSVTVGSQPLSE